MPERQPSSAALLAALDAAVPLWAQRARGWEPGRLHREAERCADIIACGADVLFRHDPGYSRKDLLLPTLADLTAGQVKAGVKARSYRPAEIFNAVAEALGIGSLIPGGAVFLGRVWCAAHPREHQPGTSGRCTACQAREDAA